MARPSALTRSHSPTTQSWGERGYGRIQRGKIGAGEADDRLYECGLGCIAYYTFLPVGGVRRERDFARGFPFASYIHTD